MQRVPLQAQIRDILGKKVKNLRKIGLLPAHVFGKNIPTVNISVKTTDFLSAFKTTGESGLIDLKIGSENARPVLVRDLSRNVVTDDILHIDFYQVNLKESVRVSVFVILKGEQPELVHSGEAVVIQPINEVEVEALPTDLPENIEVDITSLKAIGDSILVSNLTVPEGVTIHADGESVVVKLDRAVTEEMQKLLEEQAQEQAAAQEAAAEAGETAEGIEAPAEGTAEGEAAETGVGEKEAETESAEERQERAEKPDESSKE